MQEWFALDVRHVRNPDNAPVSASRGGANDEEDALLIKQRRLVPDDLAHSGRLYMGVPA